MLSAKDPCVHATSGPVVTATLSVAVRVDIVALPELTAMLSGLKDN